jgi:hypothetical protein
MGRGLLPKPPYLRLRFASAQGPVEMDRSDTVFDVSRRIHPNRFPLRGDRSVPVAPPLGGVGSGFGESGGRGGLLQHRSADQAPLPPPPLRFGAGTFPPSGGPIRVDQPSLPLWGEYVGPERVRGEGGYPPQPPVRLAIIFSISWNTIGFVR